MRTAVERAETPRDRAQRQALDEDMRENPLAGAPIRRRLRNFRPDATAQLAALGGPLAWMRRLRAIETAIELHELQLAEAWGSLREECGNDTARFAREWRPMNPRTGDFVLVNGRPYSREPLDASWILARFPAES